MKTQAGPRYWIFQEGKPVSVVSLREPVGAMTRALFIEAELSKEEKQFWKEKNYPQRLMSFEAFGISISGWFMGRAIYRDGTGPLLFRLLHRENDAEYEPIFETEDEMRIAFRALVGRYRAKPIAAPSEDYKPRKDTWWTYPLKEK